MLVVILLRSTFSHELGINKPQFFLQRNSKCLSLFPLIIHFLLNVQNNGHLQWGNSCFCFLTPLLLPPTTTPHLMFLYYHYELMDLYLPNALYSFTVIIFKFFWSCPILSTLFYAYSTSLCVIVFFRVTVHL